MTFRLPELPYALDALQPHMSEETLEFHWGKHHRKYVETLNELVQGTPLDGRPLEDVVREARGKLADNAGQHWNHSFFWPCLSPSGGGEPAGRLAEAIDEAFGSFDDFKRQFTERAVGLFGSGWCWLVQGSRGGLALQQTANAGTPITRGDVPLLTCDVWEHAYYLDHRHDRGRFLDAFWELVDWRHVARNLQRSDVAAV